VVERIRQKNIGLKIDWKIVENPSDIERRSILSPEQRGLFDRGVDQAISEGRVDFAVHSMKDIPVDDRNARLIIAGVPERGSPAEVLVSNKATRVKDLPAGSRIGASSPIRAAQLRRMRPDVKAEPLFGDVASRLVKMDRGEFDGMILAEAGLARLGLTERMSERLPADDFMPAPGQGALGVMARRDNRRVIEVLKSIEHTPTRVEAEAERELVRIVEETLRVPMGALASARGDRLDVRACVLSMKGNERLVANRSGLAREGTKLAREIGDELSGKGAARLAESWRNRT